MIAIVDYGLGNLRSIQNMLRRAGAPSVISSDPAVLRQVDKLILPGVGHFRYGMEKLRERGLVDVLNERALDAKVPVLGICLGAQLLGRGSEEGGAEGLGWVEMDTVAFDRSRLTGGERVPHMGWAETAHSGHSLFQGQEEPPRFYYVHSFHLRCDDPAAVIATAEHGYRFASAVMQGNIMGVQFHPEKSHAFGLRLLKAFAAMSLPR
ncbi:MAG: imidazole glycerol phosphate synthase subunit HisH [Deltaproteobacteria bacterium]|nr:imidazole glycerol phosphate synthase subunit HisH [Deltaproteobacteria bacterium]